MKDALILGAAFVATIYLVFAAAVYVSIWLVPLVLVAGGVTVAQLAWWLCHRAAGRSLSHDRTRSLYPPG